MFILYIESYFSEHFGARVTFVFLKRRKHIYSNMQMSILVERFINADTTIFTVNAKTQIISAVCVIVPTNCCCLSLLKYRIRWRGHRPDLRLWPDSLDL